MSKRLSDHISSSYIEAANRLSSKKARRRVVAYVESYDDIFFWRSVLSDFENESMFFEVLLPARPDRLDRLDRGKKAALMSLVGGKVGSDMIACVDADYDYLVQGASPTSQKILSNPYVFHTYAYAIENLQCYAPSLHDVCVGVTLNDHAVFDLDEYMRLYSKAIFPLFVWSIWCYRSDHYGEFSITDFLKVIELGKFSVRHADALLQNLRRKVDRRCAVMRKRYPDAKDSYLAVKDDLKRLGVTADTTYLYIQGHHLFDKVVAPMLENVCSILVRERQQEIAQQSVHGTQCRNELSCYANSIGNVRMMLKKNFGYLRSEVFARIRADIASYMGKLAETANNKGGRDDNSSLLPVHQSQTEGDGGAP